MTIDDLFTLKGLVAISTAFVVLAFPFVITWIWEHFRK